MYFNFWFFLNKRRPRNRNRIFGVTFYTWVVLARVNQYTNICYNRAKNSHLMSKCTGKIPNFHSFVGYKTKNPAPTEVKLGANMVDSPYKFLGTKPKYPSTVPVLPRPLHFVDVEKSNNDKNMPNPSIGRNAAANGPIYVVSQKSSTPN